MNFQPESPPTTTEPQVLADWMYRQLLRLADTEPHLWEPRYAAPDKPREGMVELADGTSWNPGGTGAGLYIYLSGSWTKL